MDKTTSGWINGFLGVLIFSGSLPATRVAVMDFDPVFLTVARAAIAGHAGARAAARLSGEAAGARRSRLAGHRCARRRRRLSAADRAGAEARHLGPFHRLHRPAAAGDRDLRRAARRRTAAPGVLAVLVPRQRAGGRLCADAGRRRLAGRRPADAGRHHRLRPRLCRRRQAVAQARRLAGDLLGAGAVAAGHAGARAHTRCRRPSPASASPPGSAWPMSRCSAC